MTNQADKIISKLLNTTKLFEIDTKRFLDSFGAEELFSFSLSDEQRKTLLHSYSEFSLKVKKNIEEYETNVSELSLLICKADKAQDFELTKRLSSEFDRCSLLFSAARRFISNCESVLLDKNLPVKQSTVIQQTRELLAAITNYKNNF